MTPDERFERLESGLADVTATLRVIAGLQLGQAESLTQLTVLMDKHVDAADARMKRIEENLDAADARMTRIEENLDGLIRAITSEHSNGKNKN